MALPIAPPLTVTAAIIAANEYAFGFPKQTLAYWEPLHYENDREYYFKRMLGWQSEGGPDRALFGDYAVPPSPWRTAMTAPTVPTPPPAPPTPPVTPVPEPVDDMQYLKIVALLESIVTHVEAIFARQDRTLSGSYGITLKPKA